MSTTKYITKNSVYKVKGVVPNKGSSRIIAGKPFIEWGGHAYAIIGGYDPRQTTIDGFTDESGPFINGKPTSLDRLPAHLQYPFEEGQCMVGLLFNLETGRIPNSKRDENMITTSTLERIDAA